MTAVAEPTPAGAGRADPWRIATGPGRAFPPWVMQAGWIGASWLLGTWATFSVAQAFGPTQRQGAVAMSAVALLLAACLAAAPSWAVRAVAVLVALAGGVAVTHASIGATPVVVTMLSVSVASAALVGWPLVPGSPALATAAERPCLVAVPFVAAAGATWHRWTSPVLVLACLAVALVLVISQRLAPDVLAPADRAIVAGAVRLGSAVAGAVLAVVAVVLLWLPGAVSAVLVASRKSVRRHRSSWRARTAGLGDHRRDAAFPFASADGAARRRQVAGGLVVASLLVVGLAVAIRSRPPTVERLAVDPQGAPTGQATAVNERKRYGDLPAGAGLAWADQVQEDKNNLLLPVDASGQYSTGTYRSATVNVIGGERKTMAPAPCSCTPREVWLVGGSAAFGSGQRDLHTIASNLVRLAAAEGRSVRVRNLGVPGYTLWQEYLLVIGRLARPGSRPDLVIFYDGFNDVSDSVSQTILTGPAWDRPVIDVPTPDLTDPLVSMSRLGSDGIRRALEPEGGTKGVARRIAERYGKLSQLVVQLLQGQGVRAEVFFQPDALVTKVQTAAGWDALLGRSAGILAVRDALRSVLSEVRRRLPASVHDLRSVFDGDTRPVFFDSVHTNEVGARVVADAIYQQVRPLLAASSGGGSGG